jgi:hypothetical protein
MEDPTTSIEFVFSRSTRRFCRVLIRADMSAMSWLEAMVRVATMRKTANAQTRGWQHLVRSRRSQNT